MIHDHPFSGAIHLVDYFCQSLALSHLQLHPFFVDCHRWLHMTTFPFLVMRCHWEFKVVPTLPLKLTAFIVPQIWDNTTSLLVNMMETHLSHDTLSNIATNSLVRVQVVTEMMTNTRHVSWVRNISIHRQYFSCSQASRWSIGSFRVKHMSNELLHFFQES